METATKLDILRKAAKLMRRDLTSATYQSDHKCTNAAGNCYHCLRQHLQTASELAEASYAIMDTVDDILGQWPGTNGDGDIEDDSLRARTAGDRKRHKEVHDMHKNVYRMMNEVCRQMAQVRLTAGEIQD